MNNGIKYAFVFTLGAAIGSVVTWKIVKTKYEQIAQEEIDSVKETFAKNRERMLEEHCDIVEDAEKIEEKGGSESMDASGPKVITPEEFGEEDDFETESLTYYADGVLTDDQDNLISDVAGTVGEDFADHFGEFEDDSVFIRNARLKTDFEILADSRCYPDRVIARYTGAPNPDDEE